MPSYSEAPVGWQLAGQERRFGQAADSWQDDKKISVIFRWYSQET